MDHRAQHYFVLEFLRGEIFLNLVATYGSIEGTGFAEFVPGLSGNIVVASFVRMSFACLEVGSPFHAANFINNIYVRIKITI